MGYNGKKEMFNVKKILISLLIVTLIFCSCNNNSEIASLQSQITELQKENETLKSQLEESIPSQEVIKPVDDTVNNDKFKKTATIIVTEKNIKQQDYNEFIEMVYVVTNNTNKDMKGIEGIMHIKDMFGKSIMDIQWDILQPIPKKATQKITGFGLDYNQFMATQQKIYNAPFDSLIFEYEFKTIIFSDGTRIEA